MLRGGEVDRTGSESCPMASSDIRGAEPLVVTTSELVRSKGNRS
jgi:hypothetical protein